MSERKIPQSLVTVDESALTGAAHRRELIEAMEWTVEVADDSHAANTLRNYELHWAHFTDWCARMQQAAPDMISAMPTNDRTLAIYLGGHRDIPPTTMERRLSAIRYAHQRNGHENPFDRAPGFEIVFKGYRRRWARTQKPAPQTAATEDVVERFLAHIDTNTATGIRNRAILLLTFDGAFRRSEVVSIDIDDLVHNEQGIDVRLRFSKTNQYGDKDEVIAILERPTSPHCPVAAINLWLATSGITDGPLFRSMIRNGTDYQASSKRLSDQAIYRLVKELAAKAGIEGRWGAHSLRSGHITSALQRGERTDTVQRHVRHSSLSTTGRYAQARDKYKEHPSRSLKQ